MRRHTRARALEIFRSAIDWSPDELSHRVKVECDGDEDLMRELEALLEADSNPASFMDLDVADVLREVGDAEEAPDRFIGKDAIGGYELVRVLDYGGMGTVYEAWQQEPHRKVAIKTLRDPIGSEAANARFKFEAEVLARLQHPNIAQVYESGTFGEGPTAAPYFAMEFIDDARDLLTCADEEDLDRNARLRLFENVCEAIQHGHDRGVLHRDLKPSNVLVDSNGRVAVIDFGLARALDAVDGDPLATQTGQLVGTLRYMSPEQFEGSSDLDVRSDVYSLGLVLFELLSGAFPWDLRDLSLAQVVRRISEREPRRLGALDKSLRGEYEWIVSRAIARDRDERYPSVAALRADVTAAIATKPVSVGPPTVLYRVSKFIRRHRVGVAIGSVACVAAIIGTVYAFGQRSLARDRLVERNAELEYSAEASGFMTRIFTALDPELAQGTEPTIRDVVDQAIVELEFDPPEHPLVDGLVRADLGETLLYLGDEERALELLEDSAATLRAELGPLDDRTIDAQRSVLQVRVLRGDRVEALGDLETLCTTVRDEFGEDHVVTLDTELAFAEALGWAGRTPEGVEFAERVSARADQALGSTDPMAVNALDTLVVLLIEAERFPEASARLKELASRRPDRADLHPSQIAFDSKNASLMHALEDTEAATKLLRDVVARADVVYGESSPMAQHFRARLGVDLALGGEVDEAREILGSIRDELLDPGREKVRADAAALRTTALGFIHTTDFDSAEQIIETLVDLEESTSLVPTPESLRVRLMLANVTGNQGDSGRAKIMTEQILAAAEVHLERDDMIAVVSRSNLAVYLAMEGRIHESIALLPRVIEDTERAAGTPVSEGVLRARGNLANMLCAVGEAEDAAKIFDDLVSLRLERFAPDHDSVIDLQLKRALTAGTMGKPVEGAKIADETMRLQRDRAGGVSDRSLAREREYATVLIRAGRFEDAAETLERIRELTASAGEELIDVDWHQAGRLANARGEWSEAAEALDRAIAMAVESGYVLDRDIDIMRADRALTRLGVDPDDAEAAAKLGAVIERLGRELGPRCMAIVDLEQAKERVLGLHAR